MGFQPGELCRSYFWNHTQTNISLSYQHDWRLNIAWRDNKYRKLELGFGGRLNASIGGDAFFTSVLPMVENPNYLNGTYQSKYISDTDPTHSDSVHFSSTQITSINFMIHIGYFITERLSIGTNWDVVGYGFGGTRSGTYINGSFTQPVTATPEHFNLDAVVGSDSERQGCLFREFYIAYDFGKGTATNTGHAIISPLEGST